VTRTVVLDVMRYNPEQDAEPRFQRYEVECEEEWVVLDALNHVKATQDPTLSYRWSCHMAVCGSCGMMIDGEPKLACKSFLRDYDGPIRVEPLAHFPIERDLVTVIDDFVKKLEGIQPYIVPKTPRTLEDGEYLQTPAELARYEQFSGCINCMLCYSACPQYGLDPDFTGPGVLALLHRYNADSRDGGQDKRMEVVRAEDGVWGCTAVGYCSEVCPKGVDPANAVNQNKTASAIDFFLRFLKPAGGKP